MPFGYELTFLVIFVAVVAVFAIANGYIDRALGKYRERLGGDPQPTTAWSRRVESIRTRIEAQSLSRFMRGDAPIDKDAELRRRLEVPDNA